MAILIDRDTLHFRVSHEMDGSKLYLPIDFQEMISSEPPVDAAPVRYGRWIKPTGMMPPEHHGHYECNLCGGWAMRNWKNPLTSVVLSDYCPHCGAVMKGQKDEAG